MVEARFHSDGQGPDGRPTIEVQSFTLSFDRVELSGTGVVHEGNILVGLLDAADDEPQWQSVQASVGGPQRGEWSASVSTQSRPRRVLIAEADAHRGGIRASSLIALDVAADGAVTQALS